MDKLFQGTKEGSRQFGLKEGSSSSSRVKEDFNFFLIVVLISKFHY